MKLSIPEEAKETVLNDLKIANSEFNKIYPGDSSLRQPVHTVYGGANLFSRDSTQKMGKAALKSFLTYAPNFVVLAKVLQLTGHELLPDDATQIKTLQSKLDKLTDNDRKKEPAWLPY